MGRFAAKLLFQYRVGEDASASTFRTCEERIVLINAINAKSALNKAKKLGIKGRLRYETSELEIVHFDFIGVRDMVDLGICEENEVWYDIKTYRKPMERRATLIPSDKAILNHT